MKNKNSTLDTLTRYTVIMLLRSSIAIASIYGSLELLGIFDGTFNGQQLLYYTILSNVIIALTYSFFSISSILKSEKQGFKYLNQASEDIMGALTLMILVTGLIYHLVLVPSVVDINQYGGHPFASFLTHSFVPIAVVIDWLFGVRIHDPKSLRPITWLFIPLAYWILAISYASFKIPILDTNSYYAYFFIDSSQLGVGVVLRNVILFSIFFLVLGYILKIIKIGEDYRKK